MLHLWGGPHHGTIDVTHDYIVGNKCSLLPRDVQYMLQLIHLCHIDIKTSTSLGTLLYQCISLVILEDDAIVPFGHFLQ